MSKSAALFLVKKYQYWSDKLQKAIQKQQFHTYQQQKQEHLLYQIYQYAQQLKKLGIATTLGVTIGLSSPVASQINYNTNPNYSPVTVQDSIEGGAVVFVDTDGDGDMDIVSSDLFPHYYPSYTANNYYYENTGSISRSNYVKRPALFNVTSINRPTFVDIDGDGDLDCFAGTHDYYYRGESMSYFENTGSVTNPIFTKKTGVSNPLDSINIYNPHDLNHSISFVDIDTDGDYDCFYSSRDSANTYSFKFYQNIGTATNPMLIKNDSLNPMNNSVIQQYAPFASGSPQFYDMDNDGDMDVLIREKYYENIGTWTQANFIRRTGSMNPFHFIETELSNMIVPSLNLGLTSCSCEPEIFGYTPNRGSVYNKYNYQFIDSPCYKSINQVINNKIKISPNPSTGIFQLEQSLSGVLTVYSQIGQLVLSKRIEETQSINLTHLDAGIYILNIETDNELLQQKIIIQKE